MHLALLQPDQPGNVGAILRLCACFSIPLHIIRPAGFPVSAPALRRAAMDYAHLVDIRLHDDWDSFAHAVPGRRVLLTAHGATPLPAFAFRPGDILLMGSESTGAPAHVHDAADARVRIPLAAGTRSLNLAVSAGIALAEALRQTDGFPT